MSVPHVLPHQRYVRGRVVLIKSRHIQVIYKVDQLLVAGGAEVLARLLLKGSLDCERGVTNTSHTRDVHVTYL